MRQRFNFLSAAFLVAALVLALTGLVYQEWMGAIMSVIAVGLAWVTSR